MLFTLGDVRRRGGNIFFTFFGYLSLLYRGHLKYKFLEFLESSTKYYSMFCKKSPYNLQNRPSFHSEERLVHLVRRRELFGCLSLFSL